MRSAATQLRFFMHKPRQSRRPGYPNVSKTLRAGKKKLEITLVSNKLKTNDQTLISVKAFFKGICDALDYDNVNIEKIVFADDDNYGKEITKVDPKAGYTNTKDHTGFGKTMFIENRKNIIILNECFFQIIVKIINENDFSSYPNKLYLHLIAHEIGHCIQNTKTLEKEISNYDDLRHVSTMHNYYFPILIDEYEANKNISTLYTESDVLEEIKTFFIDDLIKYSYKYFDEHVGLFESISIFWLMNVQFAKLCALLVGHSINTFEEYLIKVHPKFKYKEISDLYIRYSSSLLTKNELLENLLRFRIKRDC
jgi:hypothetical protein